MEVNFAPEVQAKIDQLVSETGRSADKLVEDAMAIYMTELAETQEMLDSRYDDLKNGKTEPIDGEEAFARLKAKTKARRNRSA